ncbi:hypothetical protein LLG96_07130 [bacterium]|nr:hypothetical protein [bacterium]
MDSKQQIFQEQFIQPIGKTGRYTILTACVCLFFPGAYLWFFHGLMPPLGSLVQALIGIWSFAIVFSILEPIIYFSLIGFGGTYMSFLTGNLVNLRLPISVTTQQVVGTKEGTPESEIVSTLGVAGSLIASQLILTVGVLVFLPFLGKLNTAGTSTTVALNHVLPALLGSVAGMYIFKNARLGIAPVTLGVIIAFLFPKVPTSYAIFPLVVVSVLTARFMYKRGWIKA